MTSVTIRDAPPAGVQPFSTESPAELAQYRAVLETSLGNITLEFTPDKAPNHVRNFLRLAAAGVYDRTAFHRVVPGFMIQTGYLGSKQIAMDEAQQKLVGALEPEFNDTPHDKGIAVDGPRGRPGQRQHLLLYRYGARGGHRRQVHGLWPRRGRHGRRRGH